MSEDGKCGSHKDRSHVIRVLGWLVLCIGVFSALLAPLEMQCFSFFSKGGIFYYEGFGFGSFMFGIISAQIILYIFFAVVIIILGYGHIRLRGWVARLAPAFLWMWLAIGIPIVVVAVFLSLGTKDLSVAGAVLVIALLAAAYIVPGLLIRFYRNGNTVSTLKAADPRSYWLDKIPLPVLVSVLICMYHIIVLFIMIYFNSLFPAFGVFLHGLPGNIAIDVMIACLVLLVLGLLGMRRWAWWGALVLLALLLVTLAFTFSIHSYSGLLSILAFPPREMEFLVNIPLQGWHFAVLLGLPLAAGLLSIVISGKFYRHVKQ